MARTSDSQPGVGVTLVGQGHATVAVQGAPADRVVVPCQQVAEGATAVTSGGPCEGLELLARTDVLNSQAAGVADLAAGLVDEAPDSLHGVTGKATMMTKTKGSNTPGDTPDKCGYLGETQADIVPLGEAVDLQLLALRADESIDEATSPNTRRAYEGDLKRFAGWCNANRLVAMPASDETLRLYMRYLGDTSGPGRKKPHKVSTIERALAAICSSHARGGHPSPWAHKAVEDMREALRFEKGIKRMKRKAADDEILRRLVTMLPPSLIGLRDRALLTMGWSGALRQSELVGMCVEHVERAPKGLVVTVPQSKTDQHAEGERVPIFFANNPDVCPVRALDAWLAATGVEKGAIFRALGRDGRLRSDGLRPVAVYERIRYYARLAGFDNWREFGGHSLRRGFISTAARRGRDLDSIMVTTRHRSVASVREYIERETIFERAAGEGLL